MRSAFFGFHVASSALFTARGNLNVISHNIANAGIPGFSRQVAQARANMPLSLNDGRGMYGTGSRVTGIIQIRDHFLDRQFWSQRAVLGSNVARNNHLSFMETVFNDLNNAGVLRSFTDFFARMHNLTENTSGATLRNGVITQAETLAEMINHNARALQSQQRDINREVSDTVGIINSLGVQITSLNVQIRIFEQDGSNANDLRDQRALLIDQLSELVNIQVEERDFSGPGNPNDRRLSILINGHDFINNDSLNRLMVVPRTPEQRRNEMDIEGLYDVRFTNGSLFNIYSRTLGGTLRGLIDVRDGNGGHNVDFMNFVTLHVGTVLVDYDERGVGADEYVRIQLTLDPASGVSPADVPSSGFVVINGQRLAFTKYGDSPLELDIDISHANFDLLNLAAGADNIRIEELNHSVFREVSGQPTSNFAGIPFYMNQLNLLVRTFARAMNEGRNVNFERIEGTTGHIFGFDANGINTQTMLFTFRGDDGNPPQTNDLRRWVAADANGNPLRDANGNLVTFATLAEAEATTHGAYIDNLGNPQFTLDLSGMNALNFMVHSKLTASGGDQFLATRSSIDSGASDNDIILGFNRIGTDPTLFRQGRFIDFIIATTNQLAVDRNQAIRFHASYEEITMRTHNLRLAVKDVDVNEEMMNLVRFQTMFTAAARLVNVMDNVYDTLINRLGNI